MPDRASLLRVISGEDIAVAESVLADWGRVTHLGAASTREQRLLADALLGLALTDGWRRRCWRRSSPSWTLDWSTSR